MQAETAIDIWERDIDAGESAKAYQAFVLYRDMGPRRSLDKAYRASIQADSGNRPGRAQQRQDSGEVRAPRYWQEWCSRRDWVRRSEAYDAFLERRARDAREADHTKEIEDYRSRQKQLAVINTKLSISLLDKLSRRTAKLEENDIPTNLLPAFLRAAAAVAEAASNAEAQSLAVGELLSLLDAPRTTDR